MNRGDAADRRTAVGDRAAAPMDSRRRGDAPIGKRPPMWLRDTAPQGVPIAEVGPRAGSASEHASQLEATDPRGHAPHSGTGDRSAAPHGGPVDLTGPHGAAPRRTA
ncbi:MAG TPA: hypothetical protein VH442_17040, partial [Micromonosporaceae bacterium]